MLCPIAGGNWNNWATAGVWAVNCNNARTNSNDYAGFRADSASPRIRKRNGGEEGGTFRPWAKSLCRPPSGSASERRRCGS